MLVPDLARISIFGIIVLRHCNWPSDTLLNSANHTFLTYPLNQRTAEPLTCFYWYVKNNHKDICGDELLPEEMLCLLTSLMGEMGSFQRPSASALRPASSAASLALRIRAAASARGLQLGRLLLNMSSVSACKACRLLFHLRTPLSTTACTYAYSWQVLAPAAST